MVKRYIDRVFGEQVNMTYYDAAREKVQTLYKEILDQAQERYWPHPLVLMDGRIVMAGDVDAYRLTSWVEKALSEQGAGAEDAG